MGISSAAVMKLYKELFFFNGMKSILTKTFSFTGSHDFVKLQLCFKLGQYSPLQTK